MAQGFAAHALGLALVQGVESQAVEYYVGIDGRAVIPTGTYAGLDNPNYGRLTFLYAHLNETDPTRNQYRGIGTYSYSGPADASVINPNECQQPDSGDLYGAATLTPLPR